MRRMGRQRRRRILVLLLVTLVSVAVFVLMQVSSSVPSTQLVGRSAPDFTISTWNSSPRQMVHLAALKGKPIVVNFWASWCEACRIEAPTFENVWRKYQARGVVFVGVAFADNQADGTNFLRQYHITYLNGPDSTGTISKAYGITDVGVPQTVFIDRGGKIVSISIGAMDDGALDQAIQALLP